jgi:hypothetical protein
MIVIILDLITKVKFQKKEHFNSETQRTWRQYEVFGAEPTVVKKNVTLMESEC